MDRISDANMSAVLARLEAVALVPPDDLGAEARAMFESIAANNRSRPWSQAHAFALADYCRVAVAWVEQMREIEREGMLVANKPNPRFKVTQLLSADRLRLGKILGLHVGPRDSATGGTSKDGEGARRVGAAMADSAEAPGGHLLA